jgi:hypothetical protein
MKAADALNAGPILLPRSGGVQAAGFRGRIPVIASGATAAGAAERQDANSRGWSVAEPHRHEVKEIFELSVENNVLKAGTLIFANLP